MSSNTKSEHSYDVECPACKTTKYRNPQMKLMVNVCGHALCDNCVRTLFVKESGQCPECDMVLKRGKFRVQVFEDPLVEKEIDIRRRVFRVYNKIEEDFESPAEYDDYLEEIEDVVYSLANDVNRTETERKLEAYEKSHKDEIKKNYLRKSAADEELDRIIEEEKLQVLHRQQEFKKEMERLKEIHNNKRNASLLKDLMASEGDAAQIVRSHAERLKMEKEGQEHQELLSKIEENLVNPKEFSSGIRIGGSRAPVPASQADAAAIVLLKQAKPYTYEAPVLAPHLALPAWESLEGLGYLQHVRQANTVARAGGYTEHYACMRALHDFMSGHAVPADVTPVVAS